MSTNFSIIGQNVALTRLSLSNVAPLLVKMCLSLPDWSNWVITCLLMVKCGSNLSVIGEDAAKIVWYFWPNIVITCLSLVKCSY